MDGWIGIADRTIIIGWRKYIKSAKKDIFVSYCQKHKAIRRYLAKSMDWFDNIDGRVPVLSLCIASWEVTFSTWRRFCLGLWRWRRLRPPRSPDFPSTSWKIATTTAAGAGAKVAPGTQWTLSPWGRQIWNNTTTEGYIWCKMVTWQSVNNRTTFCGLKSPLT